MSSNSRQGLRVTSFGALTLAILTLFLVAVTQPATADVTGQATGHAFTLEATGLPLLSLNRVDLPPGGALGLALNVDTALLDVTAGSVSTSCSGVTTGPAVQSDCVSLIQGLEVAVGTGLLRRSLITADVLRAESHSIDTGSGATSSSTGTTITNLCIRTTLIGSCTVVTGNATLGINLLNLVTGTVTVLQQTPYTNNGSVNGSGLTVTMITASLTVLGQGLVTLRLGEADSFVGGVLQLTPTPTQTSVPTSTSTPGPVSTATNTPVATSTSTPIPTSTNTPVPGATATNTPLPTQTNTPVATSTTTPIPTATSTPDPAATATNTPLPTQTSTPVATATSTPLPTQTSTPVPTSTITPIPTATGTPDPAATATSTPQATSTAPPAPTGTSTPIPTATGTPDPNATPTQTPQVPQTAVPTATVTSTPNASSTATATSTPGGQPTATFTPVVVIITNTPPPPPPPRFFFFDLPLPQPLAGLPPIGLPPAAPIQSAPPAAPPNQNARPPAAPIEDPSLRPPTLPQRLPSTGSDGLPGADSGRRMELQLAGLVLALGILGGFAASRVRR